MFVRQGLGYSTERAWALEPSASLRGSFEAENERKIVYICGL